MAVSEYCGVDCFFWGIAKPWNADEGFNRMSGAEGFEIAGDDKVFIPADVEIDLNNRKIIVSNKDIPNPVAARYCFRNFQIGNMANTRELPMVPFRTDNF